MGKKQHKSRVDTDLSGHKRVGKKLQPPFAQMPQLGKSSWMHQRLPDMLWSVVLAGSLERDRALSCFRRLADAIHKAKNNGDFEDTRLTVLAKLSQEQVAEILVPLLSDPAAQHVLRSMLVLDSLPGKELWSPLLGPPLAEDESWNILMQSVGKALWHQSQEATDCRWMRLLAMLMSGHMKLPNEEMIKEFYYYPDYGDPKHVRPSVRAAELAFSTALDNKDSQEWAKTFWIDCMRKTPCLLLRPEQETPSIKPGTTQAKTKAVWDELAAHFMNTLSTTAPDAKHDATFGLALFALATLYDLLSLGNSQLIMSRLGLRLILECYITLKYLLVKDSPALWDTYRSYGSGQAKLTYLKLKDLDVPPRFISLEDLHSLANEDIWSEFLEINLGHWENTTLRQLSTEAEIKDIYDQYYPWTSSYVHGHWGAIRDSVFDTCVNPLHRLHRIPRTSCRTLPDVISDACMLVDKILSSVDILFPRFPLRVTL